MKVTSVSFQIFSHETEDVEKIKNALNSFLQDFLKYANISENSTEGHYGDKITLIKYDFQGKISEKIVDYLFSKLDKADLLYLISTIDSRLEKSKIHIRIDKQKFIAEGKLYLRDGDDIIKIIISSVGGPKRVKEELNKIANRAMHTQFQD
ncbi:RNA-binding domain-containing protein [Acidianus sp.]|jgi:hypothetical protein|uniref:RNA-binding domain-containing protein n=1 Tax=Acidianus sp. TaxID=1872104 RepID=UPI0028CD6424|nr:RNA-binding domain-containing protein [Acidianus sp.]